MTHVVGDSRTPFIPSLLPEGRELARWDVGGAQPTLSGPILHNGVLCIYYYGVPAFHDSRHLKGEGRLGAAKLRVDGFTSLRANRREGYVTTKAFVWASGKLGVNCEILGGNGTPEDAWVRLAILDEEGRSWPGLSRAESDAIVTDVLAGEPTWSGRTQDLQYLAGKRIRLLTAILVCVGVAQGQPGTRINRVIQLWQEGKPAIGRGVVDFSFDQAVRWSASDYDFLFLDMEHRPFNPSEMRIFLQALLDRGGSSSRATGRCVRLLS